MSAAPPFEVQEVTEATLPLVRHLRYRVYVGEMGFALAGADHVARLLFDAADERGTSLALFAGPELAATVQLIPLTADALAGPFAALDLDRRLPQHDGRAIYVSRLASDPRWRGQASLTELMKASFAHILAADARHVVILAEDKLVAFYRAMGFDLLEAHIDMPPYGAVNFMVFDMDDPRHRDGKSLAGWLFRSAFAAR